MTSRPSLPRRTRGRVVSPGTPPEDLVARAEVVETDNLRWIHIEKPTAVDRAWLEERFPAFHELDYEDIASRNQRPKVDEYDDYLFIVLHFPQYDKTVGRLNGVELDMFIGPDYVITLPNDPIQPLSYLFDRCQRKQSARDDLMAKGAGYLLYKIVDTCVDAAFPMLRKIGNKLERSEEDIFSGPSASTVRDISNAKQEIINFRKVVRPQRIALKDLERTKRYLIEDQEIYFDDINDASERIWDMLENFKEVAEALERTNEAMYSHRANDVLLVLTSISVIVLPLTLVASVFGMNVKVPGESSIEAFWVIFGLMLVLLIGMVTVFRRRGWL
ncbi:MAG: magnesium transporter CorA family protein [Solirubrobacteraceae bacterium]|nr:magnesium transporter CorA family protein [Solirubrobacteraceae bacterium]